MARCGTEIFSRAAKFAAEAPLLERLSAEADLSPEADRTTRVTIGHAEGMPLAFANIYSDLAEAIRAKQEDRTVDPAADLYPRAEDGLRSIMAVHKAVESARNDGVWVNAEPSILA